jgi:glycosyl transferase family 25
MHGFAKVDMSTYAAMQAEGSATSGSTIEAVVISLRSSQARRAAIGETLRDWDLPWRFFDALGPDAPCAIREDHARQIIEYKRRLTPGELGCYKSHYTVLSDFVAAPQSNWLMVLEDDVWFDTQFDCRRLVGQLEERGIGYVRLFAKAFKHADVVDHLDERELIRFRTDPVGLQIFLISHAAASRALASIDAITTAIDHELGRFWRNGLDNYSIFPFPALERASPSTIGHETPEEYALRSNPPFLRRLAFRIAGYMSKRLANLRFLLRV